VTLLLAGCASAPVHFHTLLPAPADEAIGSVASNYHIEVEPVRVPAQVDRLELVTRDNDGGIGLSEGELWIAPLADELRNALSVELLRQLGSADAEDARRGDYRPTTIRVDVERFDSAPGRYALIAASWSVRMQSIKGEEMVACASHAYVPVTKGYVALVRGQQRAVASVADRIASAARQLATGGTATCSVE
jgi:uncharacterized lipoprotein YmbA